jgi:MFS transporter, OPA family, glycerol-3-phosphate transporter
MTNTITQPKSLKILRFQLFTATWLSYAGFYFTRKVFSIVKGPIKEQLGANDLEVSHLFTAYLITYMLGMFLTAWLGRRMKNRTQLLFGMGLSVFCNIGVGLLFPMGHSAYYYILTIMAIHGFAQATGWPNNVGLMANWTHKMERGTLMATWGTCYQFGSVLAKSFASFVFGFAGLVWSFWATSIVLGVIWIVFYFWGKEKPEECGHPAFEEEPTHSAENKNRGKRQ